MLPLYDHLPTRRRPWVTYALIALNVVVFLWERAVFDAGYHRVVFDYGLVPARLMTSPLADLGTLLTSMFLHAPESWWHLGGNMLFLWIFGDNVEDAMGRPRFLGFYLLAGVAAALTQVAIDPASVVPMVGASGAVAGVLAAYGSLHPRAPVTILNPIPPAWLFLGVTFELPAWIVIAEFFVMNLLNGVASLGGTGGGVAFFAHLGGFVAGLVLVRVAVGQARPPSRGGGTRDDRWAGWQPPPPQHRGPLPRPNGSGHSG